MRKALIVAALVLGAMAWWGSTLPACLDSGTCHARPAAARLVAAHPAAAEQVVTYAPAVASAGGSGHTPAGLHPGRLLRLARFGLHPYMPRPRLLPWWLR